MARPQPPRNLLAITTELVQTLIAPSFSSPSSGQNTSSLAQKIDELSVAVQVRKAELVDAQKEWNELGLQHSDLGAEGIDEAVEELVEVYRPLWAFIEALEGYIADLREREQMEGAIDDEERVVARL